MKSCRRISISQAFCFSIIINATKSIFFSISFLGFFLGLQRNGMIIHDFTWEIPIKSIIVPVLTVRKTWGFLIKKNFSSRTTASNLKVTMRLSGYPAWRFKKQRKIEKRFKIISELLTGKKALTQKTWAKEIPADRNNFMFFWYVTIGNIRCFYTISRFREHPTEMWLATFSKRS